MWFFTLCLGVAIGAGASRLLGFLLVEKDAIERLEETNKINVQIIGGDMAKHPTSHKKKSGKKKGGKKK